MCSKVRREKEEPPESLPYDIIVDIIAHVPRCYYPTISLVSKSFRSLVASPELYTRRSFLGCTEHSLYVVFQKNKTNDCRLCILGPKVNSNNRLVIIRSLPLMPYEYHGRSYLSVNSKIYVVSSSSVLCIDCRFHMVQPISYIHEPMCTNVANIIDGKIYVIGDCLTDEEVSGNRWWKRVMVLDTETQMWEPTMIKPDMELGFRSPSSVVVMDDKIYMTNYENSFVYGPKERKWEKDEMLNSKFWDQACVVDNVLYYYNLYRKKLRAFDPKHRSWRVVKGLEEFLPKTAGSRCSNMVSYGGKLALFFCKDHDIWKESVDLSCAEIALERRQGGDIWGKVQWCDVVIEGGFFPMVECVAVMV